MIKAYWWPAKNFGDTLTPIILEFLTGQKIQFAKRDDTGKLLAVGSIMAALKKNDVVWGTGWNQNRTIIAPSGVTFLAVRGPLTKKLVRGAKTNIFGDPGILLPLIYKPEIKKTHKIGIIPHYVDKPFAKITDEKYIDIQADWKKVIDDILSCESIISSSLHGVIAAEAYGIPATWAVYSDKIRGCNLKFQDYFLGTGRPRQQPFKAIPPIQNLKEKQDQLIKALKLWTSISSTS